ncbi:MAG TPA: Spx/MgsR family RNA polymerase-binding regulatory protein [Burkholderiaceae bacterium]|nr:Spx/MgsR family RNA polymerase-binding regulatory protein [Burkholderiaceae bacterium]
MSTVQLYGLKNCSTCVKAMRWLEQQGVAYEFSDYRDKPLAPAALRAWAAELGGWEKLVNRASMTWRNLPQESKSPASDDEWLALVARFPALIRRPLAIDAAGRASVGFSEKKYGEIFA